jgi:hypothetical protein
MPEVSQNAPQQLTARLPSSLRPVVLEDQQRFGSPNDGGYVVPRRLFEASETLVSCGIDFDWRFEQDVARHFPAIEIRSFDRSTSFARALWWGVSRFLYSPISRKRKHMMALAKPLEYLAYRGHSRVQHQAKFIGIKASCNTVSIRDVLEMPTLRNPVIVKMDVEGAEYSILGALLPFTAAIVGIIIEFHDIDERYEDFISLTKGLQQHYDVSHVHVNNCSAITSTGLPKALEMTLVRRDLVPDRRFWDGMRYALPVDAPNDPDRPEIRIVFGESVSG